MKKKIRQYIGLFSAIAAYYTVHEGAHFLYAKAIGVYKSAHFLGLGMQVEVFAECMTEQQLGLFCTVGAAATLTVAYLLVFLSDHLSRKTAGIPRACLYYITLAMLFVDPLYLGILFRCFGGGDMNGITLLISPTAAQVLFCTLLVFHIFLFCRIVLPRYRIACQEES